MMVFQVTPNDTLVRLRAALDRNPNPTPEEYHCLADAFDAAGRVSAASSLRQRAMYLRAMYVAERRLNNDQCRNTNN